MDFILQFCNRNLTCVMLRITPCGHVYSSCPTVTVCVCCFDLLYTSQVM